MKPLKGEHSLEIISKSGLQPHFEKEEKEVAGLHRRFGQ